MPSPRRSFAPLGAFAAALLLVAAVPQPAPRAAGFIYDFRMTVRTVDDKGKVKDETPLMGHAEVSGGNGKISIVDAKGDKSMYRKGEYMLIRDEGKTLVSVDPESKTYEEMDLDAYGQALDAMAQATGAMMNVTITDLKTTTEKLGAGEEISGFPTKKYRMKQTYHMALKIAFMKRNSTNDVTTDYWVADEIKDLRNPIFEMGLRIGNILLSSARDYLEQSMTAQKELFSGMPVKTVTHAISIDDKDKKKTETTTTFEITTIRRGDVPASTWAIPAGYTKRVDETAAEQSSKTATSTGAETSEAKATEAKKDTTAAKEAAKDEAKKKLKGLFKKP